MPLASPTQLRGCVLHMCTGEDDYLMIDICWSIKGFFGMLWVLDQAYERRMDSPLCIFYPLDIWCLIDEKMGK